MKDCIFCKIIKGEIPCFKVYEDSDTMAFLSIAPVNKGHTIVILKNHTEDVFSISEEDFLKLNKTAKKLAFPVKRALGADGLNISLNNGKASGQEIFHIHMHLIPRFQGDGHISWDHENYGEGEIEAFRDKILKFTKDL